VKTCISGPAISGKTYFINSLNHSQILAYPEASRKVNSIYPELINLGNIEEFRKRVCKFQIDVETILSNSNNDNLCHIFDRGIIDNLTFLTLQNDKSFSTELSKIIDYYRTGLLKPYDIIFYFDISPFTEFTPLLLDALKDPLRKSTIDTNNFKEHIVDFRSAFIDVVNFLGLDKKVKVISANPTEDGYTKRNELVFEIIKSEIEENLLCQK
jgi:hypothetical protein